MAASPTILIATPCFGGNVTDGYCLSLHRLTVHLMRRQVGFQLHLVSSESLITRARNNIFAYFLTRSEFSHLLFIDADISFPPEAVTDLIRMKEQLCGCLYPRKQIQWEKVKEYFLTGSDVSETGIMNAARDVVVDWKKDVERDAESGIVEVDSIGTGFMLVSRSCAEQMRDHYRMSLSFRNDMYKYDEETEPANLIAVFDTMIDPENGRYLSEDYAFCRRWRDIGGRIFANLDHRLEHIGRMIY
jgi:hypothetical protein